jgi:HAD superfamily hydrolase (TIGR01509 family)
VSIPASRQTPFPGGSEQFETAVAEVYRSRSYSDRVARLDAYLLDAYDTIVYTDFTEYRHVLPALAGVYADALYREFGRLAPALSVGQISISEAFGEILRACGVEPRPDLVRAMADKSRELLLLSGRLYDDVLPFLRTLKFRGIKVAIVSNCDENTRDLLVELGVAALADALILSNEVGAVKPAAQIYQYALDKLGVTAREARFVDNNAAFCAGAAALGIQAVQIVREAREAGGAGVMTGTAVVRSLPELEVLL